MMIRKVSRKATWAIVDGDKRRSGSYTRADLAINWDAVPNACGPCGSRDIHVVGVDEGRSLIVIRCDACHHQASIRASAVDLPRQYSERDQFPTAHDSSSSNRRRR
jgi:hypothetical protein